MPLPKPSSGESRSDFISRCMGDSVMREEYPDNDQRTAVCSSQWEGKSTTMPTTKAISLQIEDGDPEGTVSAVFATLKTVDLDGDVTLPGAFENGQKVWITAYGHSSMGLSPKLTVGKGVIEADDKRAVFKGRFNLDTFIGKEHYNTIKFNGEDQQWSYEYDILEAEPGKFKGQEVQFLKKLKVHGVSPVLLGAGINTRTMSVKSFTEHGEEIVELVQDFVERAKRRNEFRQAEGRTLSATSRERLEVVAASLDSVSKSITDLLRESEPEKYTDELLKLRNEWVRTEARLNGVPID